MSALQTAVPRPMWRSHPVITAVSALLIICPLGDVAGLVPAHADNPQCPATPTDPCPPPGNGPAASWSQAHQQPPSQPHVRTICQPAGRFGQFCYQQP